MFGFVCFPLHARCFFIYKLLISYEQMRLVSPTFWSRKWAFSTPFPRLARCFIHISKWPNSTRKPHKTPFLSALSIFRLLQLFFIGIPSGNLCGVERHETQSHGHILIKGNCAVFIKYALIIANEQPRENARLRGGSLIESCAIVAGAEKISNRCNIE